MQMISFSGTTDGFRIDTLLKVKCTLKEDRFILWDYDYTNTRETHTAPIIELDKWNYHRKKDTAGEYYEYWYTYTGQKGYNRDEYKLAEISIQTWSRKSVWFGTNYFNKRGIWTTVNVRFDLDAKSIVLFNDWTSCVVNAE